MIRATTALGRHEASRTASRTDASPTNAERVDGFTRTSASEARALRQSRALRAAAAVFTALTVAASAAAPALATDYRPEPGPPTAELEVAPYHGSESFLRTMLDRRGGADHVRVPTGTRVLRIFNAHGGDDGSLVAIDGQGATVAMQPNWGGSAVLKNQANLQDGRFRFPAPETSPYFMGSESGVRLLVPEGADSLEIDSAKGTVVFRSQGSIVGVSQARIEIRHPAR